MAYVDIYAQAREEAFLQKLTVAVIDKAKAVYQGGALDLTTFEDALVVYAGPRSVDFRRFAEEIAAIVLAIAPTLTSDSTDADFLTAVNSAWIPFATLAAAKGLVTVEAAA